MSGQQSRRAFLRNAGAASVGIFMADQSLAKGFQTPNEKINFGCIGVGGKGDSDTRDASRFGNIVAICDVDEIRLNRMAERFPKAKKYSDYRRMLDEMGKEIDAVTVSTPDHTHAVAASAAMALGKHAYVQKPLTHSIMEARHLATLAKRNKVMTQMGNQGTAGSGLRRGAAQIKAGIIGNVRELHIWTNRPIWPQGIDRPAPKTPPETLDWDLWLSTAPERPYGDGYHNFAWRGWWDFGTGAIGDMACHTMNMPFMALDLRNPVSVQAETAPHNRDSYPKWAVVRYEFAATATRPALTMYWYEGTKMPSRDILTVDKPTDSGSLLVGDKGKVYNPGDYGQDARVISGGVEVGEVKFTQSPGHFDELARAIKGGPAPMSNFPDYGSALTETALLGNMAMWVPGVKVEWDAKSARAINVPELEPIIRPHFRKGWKLS